MSLRNKGDKTMKVICAVCNKEVVKTKEEIQSLTGLSTTGKVRPEKLLKLLDIYEGECIDGEDHVFSWDLEYLKHVEKLKKKHLGLLGLKEVNDTSFDEANKNIADLEKDLEDAKNMIVSLNTQKESVEKDMTETETIFEDITGTKDFEEWK